MQLFMIHSIYCIHYQLFAVELGCLRLHVFSLMQCFLPRKFDEGS